MLFSFGALKLAYEDSRMSMDSDLSNLSPCKPATSDIKTTAAAETTTTTTTNNISSLLVKERCLLDEETEALSASDTIAKDSHQESKPEGGSKSPPKTRISQSWVDIVEEEENADQNNSVSTLLVCASMCMTLD